MKQIKVYIPWVVSGDDTVAQLGEFNTMGDAERAAKADGRKLAEIETEWRDQVFAQHTPGPWRVWKADYKSSAYYVQTEYRQAGGPQIHGSAGAIAKIPPSAFHNVKANAHLIAAAPQLLAVVQEAVRINQAQLILADGFGEDGQPFTEAQKLDARAFLAKRRAAWLGASIDVIAKATGRDES